MKTNSLARCVAIVGHLHHGKTSFVQMLVDQTHEDLIDIHRQVCLLLLFPDWIIANYLETIY